MPTSPKRAKMPSSRRPWSWVSPLTIQKSHHPRKGKIYYVVVCVCFSMCVFSLVSDDSSYESLSLSFRDWCPAYAPSQTISFTHFFFLDLGWCDFWIVIECEQLLWKFFSNPGWSNGAICCGLGHLSELWNKTLCLRVFISKLMALKCQN